MASSECFIGKIIFDVPEFIGRGLGVPGIYNIMQGWGIPMIDIAGDAERVVFYPTATIKSSSVPDKYRNIRGMDIVHTDNWQTVAQWIIQDCRY